MRHRKSFNKLGRTSSHRKALLSNLANSLILHKRIVTTLAKAKELRMYVEPLATKSKLDTTHSRRTVFSYLQNKYAVKELFGEIAPKIADRPGGYTRILKLGPRQGDGTEMALIEFVDFNDFGYTQAKEQARRRRRRGGATTATTGKATAEAAPKAQAPAAPVAEAATPVEAPEAPVAEAPAAEEASAEEASAEQAPETGENA